MSSMAKIFVVVNLVLIVAVFGSAATLLGAQDDFRAALTETTTKARETSEAQKKSITRKDAQIATQIQRTGAESARADDSEQRYQLAKANNEAALQINISATSALEGLKAEYQSLRQLYEGQAEMIKTLQASAKEADQNYTNKNSAWELAVQESAARENRIAELSDSVSALQADLKGTADKLRDCEFWLAKYKERHGDITKQGMLIAAEGRVLEVRNAAGGVVILIISIGREDKVTVGTEFKLSRGSEFVGFAKVTRVLKNSAVAEFDTQFPGQGAPARSGDRAYTR